MCVHCVPFIYRVPLFVPPEIIFVAIFCPDGNCPSTESDAGKPGRSEKGGQSPQGRKSTTQAVALINLFNLYFLTNLPALCSLA